MRWLLRGSIWSLQQTAKPIRDDWLILNDEEEERGYRNDEEWENEKNNRWLDR